LRINELGKQIGIDSPMGYSQIDKSTLSWSGAILVIHMTIEHADSRRRRWLFHSLKSVVATTIIITLAA